MYLFFQFLFVIGFQPLAAEFGQVLIIYFVVVDQI
jgi:hypothetical protein